jgi:hypothetical protein
MLSDVQCRTPGVAESDWSFRLWPALAERNHIKPSRMKADRMGAALREPLPLRSTGSAKTSGFTNGRKCPIFADGFLPPAGSGLIN